MWILSQCFLCESMLDPAGTQGWRSELQPCAAACYLSPLRPEEAEEQRVGATCFHSLLVTCTWNGICAQHPPPFPLQRRCNSSCICVAPQLFPSFYSCWLKIAYCFPSISPSLGFSLEAGINCSHRLGFFVSFITVMIKIFCLLSLQKGGRCLWIGTLEGSRSTCEMLCKHLAIKGVVIFVLTSRGIEEWAELPSLLCSLIVCLVTEHIIFHYRSYLIW